MPHCQLTYNAALAVGKNITANWNEAGTGVLVLKELPGHQHEHAIWDPLNNTLECAEIQVLLSIDIDWYEGEVVASVDWADFGDHEDDGWVSVTFSDIGDEKMVAWRKAIVTMAGNLTVFGVKKP